MVPFHSLLSKKQTIERINQALKHERTFEISDTFLSLNAWLLLYIKQQTNRPLLIVNHNLYHAQKTMDMVSALYPKTVLYPQDEFITTDMLALSETLKLQRLNTIQSLIDNPNQMVVTNPSGLLKHMWPKHKFKSAYQTFKLNQAIDIDRFKAMLVSLGYEASPEVEKVGDFATRGSLIDVFLSDEDHPIRIDFFDTDIDSIRRFDIKTQRSFEKIDAFTVFPRNEFFADDQTIDTIETNVHHHQAFQTLPLDAKTRVEEELTMLRQTSQQDQLSRYMSFADTKTATIKDYLDDPIIIFIESDKVQHSAHHLVKDLDAWMADNHDYAKMGFQFMQDIDQLYYTKRIDLNTFKAKHTKHFTMPLRAKETMHYENNMHMLLKDLKKYDGYVTVLITLTDQKRIESLIELAENHVDIKRLGEHDEPFAKKINIKQGETPLAFEWFDVEFVLMNEDTIYKETSTKKKKKRPVFKGAETVKQAESLKKGDYIVHYDYGIGRFLGIETKEVSKQVNDYIVIAYKGDDKLYIPVENVHLIQRYQAHEGIKPKLNKIGSPEWGKTKTKVRKKAKDIAKNLIKLYAAREQAEGFAYSKDQDLMLDFETDFPYEETTDQIEAIDAVKKDMEKPIPMDRLICGDVGYGKTEVALRAAFKATLDNKQVVYLAPTTILSRQHYYTFKERMAKHGIKIALLNRFVTPKQQKHFIEGIKTGDIDIVIGTHRLLSKDIVYKDLGLLIVDEEQRFGVKHKETIKTMKLHVDVLSLSATPIPRTLQMAITGVKELSLIETPPKNRFPVQTYVLRRNDNVIQDAIERELGRNGQIFYLYNRVEGIERMTRKLNALVPDARIAYAHGQMSRIELENVMRDFLDHQYDVLVSTTIIETGIDIPNANTLIIHDSDYLGLSQLYQIRGRVGRSDRIAYSYLMYENNKQLNEEATKRLQAIKEFTELGSGYKIASRDLAIRGAGDLLGTEQSGYIDSVGIDLFLEILKEEIDKGKEKSSVKRDETKQKQTIKLPASRSIPKDYIQDEDTIIELHKKIANLENTWDLQALLDECEDRYGKVPKDMVLYMLEKLYEHLAIKVGVERARKTKTQTIFVLNEEASKNIHGELLFEKANELSPHIHLAYKKNKLHITIDHLKVSKDMLYYITPLLEVLN